jgi:hypothetical protein
LSGFVAAHDYFQEIFAGVFGQVFESHVVDDDEIRFEVFPHGMFQAQQSQGRLGMWIHLQL